MATASKFTKISVVQSLTMDEAKALVKFMELVSQEKLSVTNQQLVVAIYQSLKKAGV